MVWVMYQTTILVMKQIPQFKDLSLSRSPNSQPTPLPPPFKNSSNSSKQNYPKQEAQCLNPKPQSHIDSRNQTDRSLIDSRNQNDLNQSPTLTLKHQWLDKKNKNSRTTPASLASVRSITRVTKMMPMKVRTSKNKAIRKATNRRQKLTLQKPNKVDWIQQDLTLQ